MAEAFPSAILDSVLKKLEHPIFPNKRCMNLHIPLQELQTKLELIKNVINEAERMAVMFPKYFRKWLFELQRVLYEVDDLLDEALIRSASRPGMVERLGLYVHNLSFGSTLAPKIKGINSTLADIIEECYKCNLIVAGEPGGPQFIPAARKGILHYHPPDYVKDNEFLMIGRDDDKKKVMKMLFNDDPSKFCVQIAGETGVGKTTLCQAVYTLMRMLKDILRFYCGLISEVML